MTPSAFFPSSYFTYHQQPGVMSADRLEGVRCPTPALAAETLCSAFTTEKIFSKTTTLLDPAKAWAPKASVTPIPDIPDPVAAAYHRRRGETEGETTSSPAYWSGRVVWLRPVTPVTVGNNTVALKVAAPAPVAPKKSEPMLNDTALL